MKKVVPIFISLAQVIRIRSLNCYFWKYQVRVMVQKEWGERDRSCTGSEKETVRGVVNGERFV